MIKKILLRTETRKISGSVTVEAAIVVPVVLFCILWTMEKGIALYMETVQVVHRQQMWEEFHPAERFRSIKWLEEQF